MPAGLLCGRDVSFGGREGGELGWGMGDGGEGREKREGKREEWAAYGEL